jgi:hypothetical protein
MLCGKGREVSKVLSKSNRIDLGLALLAIVRKPDERR